MGMSVQKDYKITDERDKAEQTKDSMSDQLEPAAQAAERDAGKSVGALDAKGLLF